ncbi:MAG: exopolysaccharide biosynthesis polyprenyl glycosylphosphotransferase [Acidimicrobiia bacterium]|nr:exopolysaccharide biosynthesis polyprenyl glycosylphosphotransferase [Acidimicrobiia bacterium]MDH4309286.1 exopolysaccharide biosynthesis polyprenyl glycosylphosphotransferase [Acidimicrobiia bacterium]MDH5294156.1 exopolysaccharide biosynthesis polyprenyl glycosylphosphotransferase [Acidimicrobiia bacterium]
MRTRFLVSMALIDVLLMAAAVVAASVIAFGAVLPWEAPRLGAQVIPLVGVLAGGVIVTSLATAGMSGPGVPRPSYGRGVAIVLGTLMLVSVTQFLFRYYYSLLLTVWTMGLFSAGVILHRFVRRLRPWTERLAVVTSEKHLADQLAESDHVEMAGVIDPQTESDLVPLDAGTTLAVDMRAVLTDRVAQFVSSCDIAGFAVRPLASVYEEHTGRIPLVHLAEGWEITTPLVRTSVFLPGKRLLDVVLIGLTAPVWIPLMAAVALAVRVSSPGPVIFSQRRIGLNGQPFTLRKFRTMYVGAEDDGPKLAKENDARIVRGGAFLRKSRLDELPQLWNVLIGDMSLVGPRAEQIPFVRQFRRRIPFYDQRHLVRPGITGWAQVNFRYAESAAETIDKLSYDLYYVKHMSPMLDLQILWKTVWTVLTASGR